MSTEIDVSVVIGFRNWGQRRLQLAVKSIQESFGSIKGEVIVSDYGSDDGQVTRKGIESTGARYIYTQTDGTWSRSRALNAGFATSRGAVLVSTDADMIFSPHSFEIIGKHILDDPTLCLLLQCRDLPFSWGDLEVAEAGFNWETFESVSRLRPRWGMGGMMAIHRDVYARIRGLDERMHTYGGEDIDFATRAKRAGQRLLWLDHPDVRMYHMWHQPTRALVEVAQEARDAIQYNTNIVSNDKSFVRNTRVWTHRLEGAPPLVSVAIATQNRAKYLSESITSVLGQSMQDFEIIIVDNGSTDNTRNVVEAFNDSRIRYFYQEKAGDASARNRALEVSRGTYTAVHDDFDLMTPWRLQSQLDALEAGIHGIFGAFVNFDDASGEMKLCRAKAFDMGTIDDTGEAPIHGTWLLETKILQQLKYDETISSGFDYNLALRMLRSGYRFTHTDEILMMRRNIPGRITFSGEHTRKLTDKQTRHLVSFGTGTESSSKLKESRGSKDSSDLRSAVHLDALLPFLPDHLVTRRASAPQLVAVTGGVDEIQVSEEGQKIGSLLASGAVSASQLAKLTATGTAHNVIAELSCRSHGSPDDVNTESPEAAIKEYLSETAEALLANANTKQAVVVTVIGTPGDIKKQLNENEFIATSRDISYQGTSRSYTFLMDPAGTAWISWTAMGCINVLKVTADQELNILAPVDPALANDGANS